MSLSLTKRQQDILGFIESEIARRGIPPTIREIAAHFGISSPNGVTCHIKALRDKGCIGYEPGISRGITLAAQAGRPVWPDPHDFPIVGEVAAGVPKLAVQAFGEATTIEEAAGARPGDFLLKVKGDSMAGAGINPGDLAIVRPGGEPGNGEIVVVMVGEEESTVKRFYKEKGGLVRLVPENPAYQPAVIDPREVPLTVVGRVVGVVRRY